MEQLYNQSLQMIKALNIKTEEEYIKLLRDYMLLSLPSLKYISGTEEFNQIVDIANYSKRKKTGKIDYINMIYFIYV